MTLTKSYLINSIANQNGFIKIRSIETIPERIKSTLASGKNILISEFGKFCGTDKRKRRGRNPAIGQDVLLRFSMVVTFEGSGKLRDKIHG